MIPRVPVVVVLGATGTGKSKLAIEIAKRFNGEIVSADSMQVYKGLDIITNKVTLEEQKTVPHHMLDVIDPLHRFTVVDFRNRALPIIQDMLSRQILPVVVGGTNYYIESLLWKVLVDEVNSDFLLYERDKCKDRNERSETEDGDSASAKKRKNESDHENEESAKKTRSEVVGEVLQGDGISENSSGAVNTEEISCARSYTITQDNVNDVSSAELHRRLSEVDPEMARRLHPNNRRKIIRSLQVFEQHGKPHSAILREQQETAGGSSLGGPLRFPHSCILWLQSQQDVLNKRLDDRVVEMIEQGLVQELLDFHKRYNEHRLSTNSVPDYTKGIFQSIGFKEFHNYLLLTEENQKSEPGQKTLSEGIEALKLVTRRYARRQIRWIQNRFLRAPDRQVPLVYALDSTDPSKWEEVVHRPAVEIVEALLRGEEPSQKPLPVVVGETNEQISYHCAVCDRVFVGTLQWKIHMDSKKHKKVILKKERKLKTTAKHEVCKAEKDCDQTTSESEISQQTEIST